MEFKEIKQAYPIGLLLEADPDIKKIEKYLNKGHCIGGYKDDELIGEYVFKDLKDKTAEIMNIAVFEKYRNQGYATQLISDAIERAKNEGFEKLKIATGKDSFQQKFYETCGFKVYETDEGYFDREYADPVIDDGITLHDLVRLEIIL